MKCQISGDYKSAKKGIISHGVFSMWIIDKFIAENKSIEVCPFCALESFYDLQGQSRREIGHWLCKEQYPYLVVNFDNLVPIGHDCTLVKH